MKFSRGRIYSQKFKIQFELGQPPFYKGVQLNVVFGHRGYHFCITSQKAYKAHQDMINRHYAEIAKEL